MQSRWKTFLSELSGKANPDAEMSEHFDLHDPRHVRLIETIRDEYSRLLMDETEEYAGCIYRPISLLPYPEPTIRKALMSLLDFAEGRRSSNYLDASIRTPEVADMISSCLNLLDDFLDVAPEELPRNPAANARFGSEFKSKGPSRH